MAWQMQNPWIDQFQRRLQPTLPPNDLEHFDTYLWNSVEYAPSEAVSSGIFDYMHADVWTCLQQDICALPLALSFLIFSYLLTFLATVIVLFTIAVFYGLLSKVYCVFYQMAYFVSSSRWHVSERDLNELRKQVVANREIIHQRYGEMKDDQAKVHGLLRSRGF